MAGQSAKFVTLLRGINVGGKNVIAKDDLRRCFEDIGFCDVTTYIQSGNILFRAEPSSGQKLTETIEARLSKRFAYNAQAVVLTKRKYDSAVATAPDGWGTDYKQKHNALFTLGGLKPKTFVAELTVPKPKIEIVTVGPGVIFWSVSKQSQQESTFTRLPSKPAYRQVTIRNHNTVLKLQQLLSDL